MFFFQAEDGIRDIGVTGVQTCALPISWLIHSPSARLNARLTTDSRRTSSGVLPAAAPDTGPIALATASSTVQATPVSRPCTTKDRKSVVQGQSVDLGGRRIIKKKTTRS